ncbi:SURF1 family protein [Kytococcus sp. Marseille-QA3725]
MTHSPHARAWRYFRSTPRWWVLAAVVVGLVVLFWRLGLWQLHNATEDGQQKALEEARSRQPAPLEKVLPVGESFPAAERGRTVTTSGSFTGEQFLVPERRLGDRTGSWVISRFETTDGASLAVLRGFLPGEVPEHAPPLPDGADERLDLTGALDAGEEPSSTRGGSDEVHGSVDLAWLANTWPPPVHNGFVFAQEATVGGSAVDLTTGGLQDVPPPPPESAGLDWQNAGYALQWWLFAGFGVWVAVRMLYDESKRAEVA